MSVEEVQVNFYQFKDHTNIFLFTWKILQRQWKVEVFIFKIQICKLPYHL